ncbi:MAG TPA: hypothetical protein V6C71_03130 [Coleofasciculaceae cyanobacterium]|jgi:hypothetical protein
MAHCILFLLGLVIIWTGLKIADEVHRLALASVGVVSLSLGYFSSPLLFQCLSGILILSAYQIYILMVESSL